MVARLLEDAPATQVAHGVTDPAVAAAMGGMDVQQAIVAGGGATPRDSNGVPWSGGYIVASGNLLADFRTNVAAESQGRLQTARIYNMTDDPGVREMLKFNNTIWQLSDGGAGPSGGWSSGEDAIDYLTDPPPLGGPGTAPKPDPQLYASYAAGQDTTG